MLVDVVGSRKVLDFRSKRDTVLSELSARHADSGMVLAPYAVTAWDEFQNILGRVTAAPEVIFDLRRGFQPLELRIAVGVGRITSKPSEGEPLNVAASGEAFERARQGMDELNGRHKYRLLTAFRSGEEDLDQALNLIYGLHDTLLQRTTARQWKTLRAVERTGSQESAAHELNVETSTVSRNLQRGYYWQMKDTCSTVSRILESVSRRLHVNVQPS